ncbi:MAG: hypothetical protein U0992_08195 [Planctomycetaceae bacterium]
MVVCRFNPFEIYVQDRRAIRDHLDGQRNSLEIPLEDFLSIFPELGGLNTSDVQILKNFLERVAHVYIKYQPDLINHVTDPTAKQAAAALFAALRDSYRTIIDELSLPQQPEPAGNPAHVADIPKSLRLGPLRAFALLGQFAEFVHSTAAESAVVRRLDLVENSVNHLATLSFGDAAAQADVPLHEFVSKIPASLRDLFQATTPGQREKKLLWLIANFFVPHDSIRRALDSAARRQTGLWGSLWPGVDAGQFDAWLNDRNSYLHPNAAALLNEEREFRLRLVSAMSSRLARGAEEDSAPGHQAQSDPTDSDRLVSECLGAYIDTLVKYVFEPESSGPGDSEWKRHEDVGQQFALLASRQIRASVRTTVSLLLTGVWKWSVNNEVLVGYISSALSTFASSIVESVIRSVTFYASVRSAYQSDTTIPANPLHRWSTLNTVEDTGQPPDGIDFIAQRRWPDGPVFTTVPALIRGVLQDTGTFIESVDRYRGSIDWPAWREDEFADAVSITRCELVGHTLTVWAATTEWFTGPAPVLKAWIRGRPVTMRPGLTAHHPYTLQVTDAAIRNGTRIGVISNRGGHALSRVWTP